MAACQAKSDAHSLPTPARVALLWTRSGRSRTLAAARVPIHRHSPPPLPSPTTRPGTHANMARAATTQEAGCEDMCSFEFDPDDECDEADCEIYQPKQDFFRATAVGMGLLVRTPSLPAHSAATAAAAFSSAPYFPSPSPVCVLQSTVLDARATRQRLPRPAQQEIDVIPWLERCAGQM
jgi:hypothetical protein